MNPLGRSKGINSDILFPVTWEEYVPTYSISGFQALKFQPASPGRTSDGHGRECFQSVTFPPWEPVSSLLFPFTEFQV